MTSRAEYFRDYRARQTALAQVRSVGNMTVVDARLFAVRDDGAVFSWSDPATGWLRVGFDGYRLHESE
jgi:hypothetical protein